MRVFNLNKNTKCDGNRFTIDGSGSLTLKRGAFVKIVVGDMGGKYNLKIIGKKRTGNGKVNLKIISRDGVVVFSEDFQFAKRSYSEFGINFDTEEAYLGCTLCIDRVNNSFGTVELGKICIKNMGGEGIKSSKHKRKKVRALNMIRDDIIDKKIEYFKYCSRKKLAFVVPYSICGGAEIYLRNLINLLDKEKFNISVLYLKNNNLKIFLKNDVKNINTKTAEHLKTNLIASNYDYIVYYNSHAVYSLLVKLVKSNAISSFLYEIYHSDFIWSDSLAKYKSRECVSAVFPISDSLAKDIGGVSRRHVLPVPIDTDLFKKRKNLALKDDLGIDHSSVVIGAVSRLSQEKNVEYILNLAEKLDDFIFVIIGDGPKRKSLEEMAISRGINNIRFVGFCKNVFDYYNIFDAFVLASTCSEGTPITILEAMSSEVPVFTTMVGAIPSFAKNGVNSIELTLNLNEDCNSIIKNIKNDFMVKNARKYIEDKHNMWLISELFTTVLLSENIYKKNVDDSDGVVLSGYYA